MSDTTKIEWCDSTFNPWIGCTRVSPACDHCYAARSTPARTLGVAWGAGELRRLTSDANWRLPLQWERKAAEFRAQHGRRRRVFCASLADVFDNEVNPVWREDLWRLIAATPNLDWLLLTKRVGNVARMLPCSPDSFGAAYPNVWLGITVVNQEEADRDIPKLLKIYARERFLSIEPMLGPISLRRFMGQGFGPAPSWVIVGGESGLGARPIHQDWARSLRDECAAVRVPLLFKQWGEWLPIGQMDEEIMNRLYRPNRVAKLHEDQDALNDSYGRRCIVPQGVHQADGSLLDITSPMAFRQGAGSMQIFKVGKQAAGRLLDGIEHNGFPKALA